MAYDAAKAHEYYMKYKKKGLKKGREKGKSKKEKQVNLVGLSTSGLNDEGQMQWALAKEKLKTEMNAALSKAKTPEEKDKIRAEYQNKALQQLKDMKADASLAKAKAQKKASTKASKSSSSKSSSSKGGSSKSSGKESNRSGNGGASSKSSASDSSGRSNGNSGNKAKNSKGISVSPADSSKSTSAADTSPASDTEEIKAEETTAEETTANASDMVSQVRDYVDKLSGKISGMSEEQKAKVRETIQAQVDVIREWLKQKGIA